MKSWKTSLTGFVFGVGWLAFKAFVLKQPLDISDFKDSAGFIAVGLLAKDSNVTGGTVPQNQTWAGKAISSIFSIFKK